MSTMTLRMRLNSLFKRLKISSSTRPATGGDISSFPELFQPRQKPWYTFNNGQWEAASAESTSVGVADSIDTSVYSRLRVITWNVEGIAWEFAQLRMECALKYLETLVSTDDGSDAAAIIIVLQEMTNLGINQVKSTAWVRERYAITDIDISRFDSSYGVMTLIPRCLAVTNAFRVRWQSRFGRDGLFVDIRLPKTRGASHFIRLCNTHLESLPSDPPMRPIQVCMANRYLHEAGIHGSVFAGDMNSEEPSDNDIARVELCESRELHLFLKWKLQV